MIQKESSLDLLAALDECTNGRAGLKQATPDDLRRLLSVIDVITDGFAEPKLTRLRELAFALRDIPDDIYAAALEGQVAGQLRSIESDKILMGAMAGLISNKAPGRFLPDDFEPSLQGSEREAFAELLYWIDTLLHESAGLREFHLSQSVGAVCVQEIKDRLAQHPTSRKVYELWSENSQSALSSLMRMIQAKTRDLSHRKEHTPRRQRNNDSAPVDDEKESILRELLWERAHDKTQDDHPLEVQRKAMDGEFESVPIEVRYRFIDHLRTEYADRRGGKVRGFETLTIGGEACSDREGNDGEEAVCRSPHPVHIPHERREVWHKLSRNIQLQELADIRESLGPAAKLLQYFLDNPDDDSTDLKLAQQLDVTTRTIRNYRARLRKLPR